MAKSELKELITDIKQNLKQVSVNKVDEVKVMRAMLNDPEFKISIYDKNLGYIGQRCPHESAIEFVKDIIQSTTGLESADSKHLAESYEFSKKDASFMIDNAKDFINVYLTTGRKINIVQNDKAESSLYAKNISASTKRIPSKNGDSKEVSTNAYTKIVSISKSPKYNN